MQITATSDEQSEQDGKRIYKVETHSKQHRTTPIQIDELRR
jgi:hypothetical protein